MWFPQFPRPFKIHLVENPEDVWSYTFITNCSGPGFCPKTAMHTGLPENVPAVKVTEQTPPEIFDTEEIQFPDVSDELEVPEQLILALSTLSTPALLVVTA
jgi:hypothetical protein